MLSRLGARLLVGSFPANLPSDGLLEVAQGAVRNAGVRADAVKKNAKSRTLHNKI